MNYFFASLPFFRPKHKFVDDTKTMAVSIRVGQHFISIN